jgi:hypothetical protein
VKPSGEEDLTSLKKAGRDISPFRRNGTAVLRSANKHLNPVELCEKLPAFLKKSQSPTLIQNDPFVSSWQFSALRSLLPPPGAGEGWGEGVPLKPINVYKMNPITNPGDWSPDGANP